LIRKAVCAGLFYPEEAGQLSNQVRHFLESVSVDQSDTPVMGGICPHASYFYSGRTSAYFIKSLQNRKNNPIKRVVIVGPSHYVSFSGASIYAGSAYETPLGEVPIDRDICQLLQKNNSSISTYPQVHQKEHSIEVILPFLQESLKDFSIIPIVVGQCDLFTIQALANTLATVCEKESTVVIASSDFSHFFDAKTAVKMDNEAADYISNWDIDLLRKRCEDMSIQLCGLAPVLTTMAIMQQWGSSKSEQLFYQHSGQISGDYDSVVGYNAFRFY
jgi:AmmeMemoRadiSam system protein B